jgi:hypothetical protein
MDQHAARTTAPLTQQVRECLEAGLTNAEGAAYVKMYDDGYRAIANLIRVSQQDPNPDVRVRALSFLTEIDRNGAIGERFQEIVRFVLAHRPEHPRQGRHRRKAERGWRNLRHRELERLTALTTRADVGEDDQSLAKRLLASVVDNRLVTRDYDQMYELITSYSKFGKLSERRERSKDGWRSIVGKHRHTPDVPTQLRDLLERKDVTEEDKSKARVFLAGVKDDRMPSIDYIDSVRLINDNRASKRERAKRALRSDTFDNAVFMACQACDNLTGIAVPVMPLRDRIRLVAMISSSAANLLRLQGELIEEKEDDY